MKTPGQSRVDSGAWAKNAQVKNWLKWALAAAIGISGVATAVGFLAFCGWPFELFCHFRVQYAVMLGSAAIAAAIARFRKLALAATGLAALNATQFAFDFSPDREASSSDSPVVRLVTFNVGVWNSDFDRVLQYVRQLQPDFVVLLEVNRDWQEVIQNLKGEYAFAEYLDHEGTFAIGLLSRHPVREFRVAKNSGSRIPIGICSLDLGETTLNVVAAHTVSPPQAELVRYRDRQLGELATIIRTCSSPVVLAGDLNCTPWSPAFRRLCRESGLRDSRRGFGIQATWPVHFFPARIPIDHFLVSDGIFVRRRFVGPDLGSDHFPVVMDIMPPPFG